MWCHLEEAFFHIQIIDMYARPPKFHVIELLNSWSMIHFLQNSISRKGKMNCTFYLWFFGRVVCDSLWVFERSRQSCRLLHILVSSICSRWSGVANLENSGSGEWQIELNITSTIYTWKHFFSTTICEHPPKSHLSHVLVFIYFFLILALSYF